MTRQKKPIHIMNIPVGGMTYKVYACPRGLGDKRSFVRLGNCDFTKHTISLNMKDLCSDEETCYVLFHELIHAAVDAATCSEKINPHGEAFIHPFARILWGAIVHSGLINDWWRGPKPKVRRRVPSAGIKRLMRKRSID